jgi:hypothetical protein
MHIVATSFREPIFFDVEEFEGVGDHVGGIMITTKADLTLNTLLRKWIKSESHGRSIAADSLYTSNQVVNGYCEGK